MEHSLAITGRFVLICVRQNLKPRLHQIGVAGYKLYPLVSLVAVYMYPVSATKCYMYTLVPRVEHCLELVFGYMYQV